MAETFFGGLHLGLWNYVAVIVLMMTGLYIVIARNHLIKKLIGLNIFQVSVFLFYVSIAKVDGGTAPVFPTDDAGALVTEGMVFSNPLPHVLMLTAIVVGVATTALGLALAMRIQDAFGTVEEDEILRIFARNDTPVSAVDDVH
ncbi:MAG: cation:proton antiporter subunit C [Acidobacteriota bacterium]